MDELKHTLAELEARADELAKAVQKGTWEWAVIIAEIHDEELYPNAGETDAFPNYMWERWKVRRSTAFHILAWVKNEIKLALDFTFLTALPGSKSNALDSPALPAPPATPVHDTARASRTARSKAKHKTKSVILPPPKAETVDLSYLTKDDWHAIGAKFSHFYPSDDPKDDCIGSFSTSAEDNIIIEIHQFNDPEERDGIVLRTEDEQVNEFYPMDAVELDCGPESTAAEEFWRKFIAFVRSYEKRAEIPEDCDGGDTTNVFTGETFQYQDDKLVGHYTRSPEELAAYNKEGVEADEKRRTEIRAKMLKRFAEARQELGDATFYGLAGDLSEDLDEAMSEIDDERDAPPS